jgi:hypothetical protein
LAGGNRSDDAAFDDFIGEFRGRPVGDRPPTVLRRLARHRQDRGHLFGGELAGAAAARQIPEELLDGLDQEALGLATFDHDQVRERVRPPATPKAHRVTFAPDLFGDLRTFQPFEGQEDHPGALSNSLRTGTGSRQSDQNLLLTFRDGDLRGSAWHRSSLWKSMETERTRKV